MNIGLAVLKRIFLDSWVLLSLGAVALGWGSCIQLQLDDPGVPLLLLLLAGSFFGYNLHPIIQLVLHKRSFKQEWALWAGMGLSTLLLLLVLFQLHSITQLLLLPLALATLLYTLPAKQVPKWLLIRRFPFIKVFLVSGVWALVTVLLPVLESNTAADPGQVWFILVARFVFFVALTLPFDVRDRQTDALEGMKTLPVVLGERTSYRLAILLDIVFVLMHLYSGLFGLESKANALPALITGIVLLALLLCRNCRSHPMYFSFWMDGLVLVFGLLLIAFSLS